MQAFIKDRKTFVTKALCLVLDYELKPSIYDTVSNIVVKTPSTLPDEGDIVYLDNGFFGVISMVLPEFGKTTLDVNQIITLFGREEFYTDTTFDYLEDYLVSLIESEYINQSDTFYAMPYLTATAATHTASALKPDLDNNIYSVKSYAAKMRRLYNIFLDWGITKDTLTVTASQKEKPVKNIDFSNPSYILTEQAFSQKTVSKITSYAEDTQEYQDWYLLSDGTITNTAPQDNRVNGEWIPLVERQAADVEDAVKDEFAKNEYSHKINFMTAENSGFSLYDRLKIKLDNKIFSSYVSGIIRKKNSQVIEVQCGELQLQYPFLDLA